MLEHHSPTMNTIPTPTSWLCPPEPIETEAELQVWLHLSFSDGTDDYWQISTQQGIDDLQATLTKTRAKGVAITGSDVTTEEA